MKKLSLKIYTMIFVLATVASLALYEGVLALVFTRGANVKAVDSSTYFATVGEIHTGNSADSWKNVQELYALLANKENATLGDVVEKIEGNGGKIDASELNTYTTKKDAGQDIRVTLAGQTWHVVYLSKDKNDNPIMTLYADQVTQYDKYGTQDATYSNDFFNHYYNDSNSMYVPNMYGTSYVHAVGLNNGGAYLGRNINSGIITIREAEKSPYAYAFRPYTYPDNYHGTVSVVDCLVTPRDVAWQEKGQSAITMAGQTNNLPNENWGETSDEGFYQADHDTVEGEKLTTNYYGRGYNGIYTKPNASQNNADFNAANSAWADDYLWLPSLSEVGIATSATNNSLWKISRAQTATFSCGNYWDCLLRSGAKDTLRNVTYLSLGNSVLISYLSVDYLKVSVNEIEICEIKNVRPALHVNLNAASVTGEQPLSSMVSTLPTEVVYDGKDYIENVIKKQEWWNNATMSVVEPSARNAGTHNLTITRSSSGLGTESVTITVNILKKDVTLIFGKTSADRIVPNVTIDGVITGDDIDTVAVYSYQGTGTFTAGTTKPTESDAVGTYTMSVSLTGSDAVNYRLNGETVKSFVKSGKPVDYSLPYKGGEYTMTDLAGVTEWYREGMTLSCEKTVRNVGSYAIKVVVKDAETSIVVEEKIVNLTITPQGLSATLTSGGWVIGQGVVLPTATGLVGKIGSDKVTAKVVYIDPNGNELAPEFDFTQASAGTYKMRVTTAGEDADNYQFVGLTEKEFVVSEKPFAGIIENDDKTEGQTNIVWILWGVVGGISIVGISVILAILIRRRKPRVSPLAV